jgi:hypothetical protein
MLWVLHADVKCGAYTQICMLWGFGIALGQDFDFGFNLPGIICGSGTLTQTACHTDNSTLITRSICVESCTASTTTPISTGVNKKQTTTT